MNNSKFRSGRLETRISIILIIILILIGSGVFIKQFFYNIEKFGLVIGSDNKSKTSIDIESLDLKSLAPEGYKEYLKSEMYNSDALYEKINGKAPLYLDAGFSKLLCQKFARIDDEKQWLELYIYEMADKKSAFSVYSTQRRRDVSAYPSISKFAYRTSNSLNFILGGFYFEIIASSDSKMLFNAISVIGEKLKSGIFKNMETVIPELSLMPQVYIVPDSIKLNINNAFGFKELTNTFTAEYKLNNKSVIGFISIQNDAGKAEEIAEKYYKFLLEYDGKEIESNLNSKAKVVDILDMIEVIFIKDKYIAGIHEAESQEIAEKMANILINKLNNEIQQK